MNKITISYFTGSAFHHVDVKIPSFDEFEEMKKTTRVVADIVYTAALEFQNEGGTHEKTQAQRFRCK